MRDKVFKNGTSKIRGRQPLKNLKWYGLLNQAVFGKFHLVHYWILCPIFNMVKNPDTCKVLFFFHIDRNSTSWAAILAQLLSSTKYYEQKSIKWNWEMNELLEQLRVNYKRNLSQSLCLVGSSSFHLIRNCKCYS